MKIYKKTKKCRICFSQKLLHILNLTDQPPANSLRNNLKEKIKSIPLNLMFCEDCCTVQLQETVKPKYLFSDYIWVTGTSNRIKSYSNFFVNNIVKKYSGENKKILEIASNDGTVLKKFKKEKFSCLGVDPAKNLVKLAKKNGIKTIPKFFNYQLSSEIKKKYGSQGIIFARNVIPHVENIHSVVKGISNLIDKDNKSLVVIEFHNSSTILNELHYDSIYHEHIFFFSIQTISNVFKKYGLFSFDIFKSPISGGSWVLFFSKNRNKKSISLKKLEEYEKRNKINRFVRWKRFSRESIIHSKKLKDKISYINKKLNKKMIAYGASARSSTMLNFSSLNNQHISFIIDKNKMKDRKFTPGTNIKIISLSKCLSLIKKEKYLLILAWNFKKEIITFLKEKGFRGKFLIPLPKKIVFK